MNTRQTQLLAGAFALAVLGGLARAQAPVPPPAPTSAVYDPQQLPATAGELERFTMTARGDIDGFIMKDGTQVITAPDLATQLAFSIKPGDRVTVHGLHAAALPLVRAVSITDEATHRTIGDSGVAADVPLARPAPPPGLPPRPAGALTETAGRVRLVLRGAQGEPNGVLLESGAILRFPPDRTAQMTSLLQPRQQLVAEGTAMTNAIGTVIDVQQLGPSRDRLIALAPPRVRDDRGPAGLPRRSAPPDRPPPPPPPAS